MASLLLAIWFTLVNKVANKIVMLKIILSCKALDCKLKGSVNPTKKEFPYRDL